MLTAKKSATMAIISFTLLSSAPFLWPAAHAGFHFIGGGDYVSPINMMDNLRYTVFPFNHLNLAGVEEASRIALFPFFLFGSLSQLIGFSSLSATLLFIGLIIFIGQISFYFYIQYIIRQKLNFKKNHLFLTVLGSIMYGFSPYVAALIIPGHFYILMVYAFFPLIIKHLDILFTSPKVNYESVLILFLLFLACSLGFSNIGVIYVLLIACLMYMMSLFLVSRGDFIRFGIRFCLFGSLIFLSNMWWLLPHLSNFKSIIAVSQSSATSITAAVRDASAYATLLNVFLGRPQHMMYMRDIVGNDYYFAGPIVGVSVGILLLFGIGLFFKKKYIYTLLIVSLISILFVKGPQPPFSDLFMWAYGHIPGFQIFRRPDSKFYGFFLAFYWAAAMSGCILVVEKYVSGKLWGWFLSLAGLVSVGYMVFIFSMTGGLIPFNIPPIYSMANDFLLKDKVKRILMLPGTYGLNPVYTTSVNSYTGQDFLNEVFSFPKISPDSSNYSPNMPYKATANDLMQLIRGGEPICEASRRLGISHIMVRQDLNPNQAMEDKPIDLIALLDKHPDINNKVTFGDGRGFIIYKLNRRCVDNLVSAQRDGEKLSSFHFSVLNPGKIILKFENIKDAVTLDFLTNYNENWKIYPYQEDIFSDCDGSDFNVQSLSSSWKHCGSLFSFGRDIQYLFRSRLTPLRHSLVYGYANRWIINLREIRQKLPSSSYHINTDGSVNLKLLLYYQTQGYVVVGFLISFVTAGWFLVQWLRWRADKGE